MENCRENVNIHTISVNFDFVIFCNLVKNNCRNLKRSLNVYINTLWTWYNFLIILVVLTYYDAILNFRVYLKMLYGLM